MDRETVALMMRTERAQTAISERAERERVSDANKLFTAWATLEGFTAMEWATARREAARLVKV
jgi:hypothetical protein